MSIKKRANIIALLLIVALLFHAIASLAPPSPHNLQGRIFTSEGVNGVQNGVFVLLNNTNNSDWVLTQVSAPPLPQFRGSYSATINGSDNETIFGISWNSTHYGTNTTNLTTTTTSLNIVLATPRPSETNVTIIIPRNNSRANITVAFNVTANITIIGGSPGTNCNATISFSDERVLNITRDQNLTNLLGDMPLGSRKQTWWNMTGNFEGVSNITVRAQCASDSLNFDRLNVYTTHNLTVEDFQSPLVQLISPANNTALTEDGTGHAVATFIYSVADGSPIKNCTLIIDNRLNVSNTSVLRFTPQSFTVRIPVGSFNWSVNCTDNATLQNTNGSGFFNVSVIENFPPSVTAVSITSPLDLSLGSALFVTCNATIGDQNNRSDIIGVNATLYQEPSFQHAPDDNNDHYTNISCHSLQNSTLESNYTCGFSLQYYANNGTWRCNITATDQYNTTGFGSTLFSINELLAIEISPQAIDYGAMQATNISPDDINMTMTNIGNVPFNITVEGYGAVSNDGLSLVCDDGSVPIGNQRYAVNASRLFSDMVSLTTSAADIGNLSLLQRTNDLALGFSSNLTYWKLQLPTLVRGNCNGTVVFKTRLW